VVTPLKDQQVLAQRIMAHWIDGAGGAYNPARRRALETIKVSDSIAAVVKISGVLKTNIRKQP
jgi:hypothetical protein